MATILFTINLHLRRDRKMKFQSTQLVSFYLNTTNFQFTACLFNYAPDKYLHVSRKSETIFHLPVFQEFAQSPYTLPVRSRITVIDHRHFFSFTSMKGYAAPSASRYENSAAGKICRTIPCNLRANSDNAKHRG